MKTTTIHEELIDELSLLVDGLKAKTERGTGEREYLNGLLRDAYVIERSAKAQADAEDSAWLSPFLDALVAKLELGPVVIPSAAGPLGQALARVVELQDRNELLRNLRKEAPAILDDPQALRGEAREYLERGNVIGALQAKRLMRGTGAGPAETILAARLLEGLGLHLGLNNAEGKKGPRDADVASLANRLEGWLTAAGATPDRPEVGAHPGEEARTVQGSRRAPGVGLGCVAEVVTPGYTVGKERVSRAVVVASAGAEAKVLSAARKLLETVPEDDARRVLPYLEAVGAALTSRMEDAGSTRALRAEAALDVVGAVLPVLETPDAIKSMLESLSQDFSGADVEILLPTPGSPFAEGVGWESRDLYTDDIEPGTIVKLLRPGMKLAGELVRPALVSVSQGPPPPGVIDEVIELLPAGDNRTDHIKTRLARARCLAAGDAGAQLARELADLALLIRDDHMCEAARRALRMVIDDPPAALVGIDGWDAVREYLDENLEQMYEDGENGEIGAYRLVRPFLQGLRTHDMAGARLRSLGESMNALLSLYDEALGEVSRAWLFGELERLASAGLPPGGHARRLMRTAAKAVGTFYTNNEGMAAMELTQALGRAGVHVYPEDEEKLNSCPTPEVFHRLEAVYGSDDRYQVVGEFEPAATTAGDGQAGVTETGAITVSLGPEPPLIQFLRGPEMQGTRLGAASERLIKELTKLSRDKLINELKGDASAERSFAVGAAQVFNSVLGEAGWQRGSDEREAFAQLFEILEEDHKVVLLPGYLTYRRLREYQDKMGAEQVKVDIVREGPKRVELKALGVVYRDELVAPLDMLWGVGNPPPYVKHLREALPWFNEVLEGSPPSIKLSPAATEAIRDFESPDAGSLEGIVGALTIIATWLATEVPDQLEIFCKEVKNAPGLELDFFPLPGKAYDNKRLIAALDQAKDPSALSVVRDTAREEGEAIQVERIAIYKGGNLVSDEPRARFALKKLPQACEDLQKAVEPILSSANVLGQVKAKLRGLITRLALIPVGDGQKGVELNAFKVLLESKLIDPSYDDEPENVLHKAGAYLVGRLSESGLLKVERFEGKITIDDALKGYDKDDAEVDDAFCLVGSAELAEVRRPLVQLEGNTIQKASLMRGVPTSEGDVLEFDKVLVDTVERLKGWVEGTGALVDPLLGKTEKQILPRTIKRITDVRKKMFRQQKKKLAILPPDTQRRDLIKFVIDQIHRAEDSMAILEDQTYRGAFGETVFKDAIFRTTGPYLSKHYRTTIDTDVVAGADTEALVGRFKKESSGPKPTRESKKIWSVVIPCYSQDGVTIRPATVRVGAYF